MNSAFCRRSPGQLTSSKNGWSITPFTPRGEEGGRKGGGEGERKRGGKGRERNRETKKKDGSGSYKKGGRRTEEGEDEEKKAVNYCMVHLKQHSLRLIISEELSLPPLMEEPSLSSGKKQSSCWAMSLAVSLMSSSSPSGQFISRFSVQMEGRVGGRGEKGGSRE